MFVLLPLYLRTPDMRSDDVCFDRGLGLENVVVVGSPTMHQPHIYTVNTGTKART